MSTKTYSQTYLFALAVLLVITVMLNRIVDPFGYYRDFNISGINVSRTEFHRLERQIKPKVLREGHYQTVIFGGSFSEIGFEPLHPALTKNGTFNSYNFGMIASTWSRVYCNVIYALEQGDMRLAILGVHPEPMPPVDCTNQRAEMNEIDTMALLLSRTAIKSSWRTLSKQKKQPAYTQEGRFFFNLYKVDQIEERFNAAFRRTLESYRGRPCLTKVTPFDDSAANWSPPRVKEINGQEGLHELLRRLGEKGVEVKLVVYPKHSLVQDLQIICGDGSIRWNYIWDIASIVEKQPGSIELWDFQGFSTMMTEQIRNNVTKNWQDTGHFNVDMGSSMLDVIFSGQYQGPVQGYDLFGYRVSTSSLAERYIQFFRNRAAFLTDHPEYYQYLAGLITHASR